MHELLLQERMGTRDRTMETLELETRNERHKKRMVRQKELVDNHIAKAVKRKGIVLVNTGNGKGKSTAAFGVAARALGAGMRVAIVQFIKGSIATGEEAFFKRFPEVKFHVMGDGYTWDTQDMEKDIATAGRGWKVAKEYLENPYYDVVILDELNIVLKLNYIDVREAIKVLKERPEKQHVVVTGRGAPKELIEYADTVTDMVCVKHAYQSGIIAQEGIEL
jgi:cob(I)alamin adenosyltransferase